jgi:hypothetical protein
MDDENIIVNVAVALDTCVYRIMVPDRANLEEGGGTLRDEKPSMES